MRIREAVSMQGDKDVRRLAQAPPADASVHSRRTAWERGVPIQTNASGERLYLVGQAAPLECHSFTLATNSACGTGTGLRPSPGFQPQSTSGVVMCSTI